MSLLKNVGTIGGLTAVSRLFGFVRDILVARVLGATAMGDAWQLAFMLPNIFRRLFAEGAFASAFVPLFNRRMKEDGDVSEARAFAENVLAVLLPILIVFGAIALMVMPWVVEYFAPDGLAEDGDSLAIATMMARITFPYLLFMSLATVFAAVLNSLSRFAAAAAAPILLNICLIAALSYGATLDGSIAARRETATFMAYALSLSGFLQLVWLILWMRKAGFRIGLVAPKVTSGVKELGILVVPAIFGAGVYQISRFIDLFFLSTLPVGSYTYLAMADRWNQLPLGIIGIALGTAILPALSRYLSREESEEAQRLQSNAVELAMLLTVPAAVALFITGSAFTRVFFGGGAFTNEDALITGTVVSGLVIGLPAYVLIKVLTPNFFARKDTRTPVYTAAASLVVTVGLNIVLVPTYGVLALAIAGAVGAWCNVTLLYIILVKRDYFHLTGRIVGRLARIAAAAAIMGAALWFTMPVLDPYFSGSSVEKAGSIAAVVLTGIVSFGIAAIALGVLDRATIARLMRRQG
ncbi:murein biosynthesis integral membrane protein MurJ [Pontixanthobacter aestiaquae]|uniref:Probable lipid II flippase MurJ n=1 Tax=Pontixanthobacter aestiaquae TaxID=1509367 RepID=A0A844Z4R6_9SPHN|nr:murein biosynthesis integral membrane protein MurJ [Pontixanthobacter aestiaquae]MDN3646518.1 murein biosynthesis integral membrane protein MurJ [Pontixanthobacter aestiaquae]MXO82494.1 murein biosynthesis integral membrane protein MurJ [Pontixanthobacter aestiaquae]